MKTFANAYWVWSAGMSFKGSYLMSSFFLHSLLIPNFLPESFHFYYQHLKYG